MGKTDTRPSQMLMRNSRAPYRVPADKLDISLQAVHRRIQVMREIGVVRNLVAVPSREALNAITLFTFGLPEGEDLDFHPMCPEVTAKADGLEGGVAECPCMAPG